MTIPALSLPIAGAVASPERAGSFPPRLCAVGGGQAAIAAAGLARLQLRAAEKRAVGGRRKQRSVYL